MDNSDHHKKNPPSYYLNEEGLVTLTEYFLLKRGYCCGNGCRHCPYNYEAVQEPRRTQLLKQRSDHGKKSS